jgi:DNA alkylation repair enzyme
VVQKNSLSAVDSLFISCQETKGLVGEILIKGGNIAVSKSNIQKDHAIEPGTPADDSSFTNLVAQIKNAFAEARDSNNALAMRRYMRDRFDFAGLDRLFEYVRANANDREFFIQKAITWALRSYAKTDKNRVRALLAELKVSPLALREATRHMTG